MPDNDKALGMDRGISRRDFLNGVAVTAGASVLPPHLAAALQHDLDPEKSADYYPPALTGLRGSHVGAFEIAHSLRDGDFWAKAGKPAETGETFDLIVVGGGISGLSAAYFFLNRIRKPAFLFSKITTTSADMPSATSSQLEIVSS